MEREKGSEDAEIKKKAANLTEVQRIAILLDRQKIQKDIFALQKDMGAAEEKYRTLILVGVIYYESPDAKGAPLTKQEIQLNFYSTRMSELLESHHTLCQKMMDVGRLE